MIRINRVKAPAELNENEVKELTEIYKKDSSKPVWNQPYIKEALLGMSHNKCFYCERHYSSPGDLAIEHFHPKGQYKEEVVNWDNLLLSCSRCNRNKGILDTKKFRIINPTEDDPRKYICLTKKYLLQGIDDNGVGKFTIETLFKNDIWDMALEYMEIYHRIGKELADIKHAYTGNMTSGYKNKIIDRLIAILKYAQPNKPYCAAIATLIINDDNFQFLYELLKKDGEVLDRELEKLYDIAEECALEYH
jgi:uncharacterized protein (TIGR02646 family)